MKFNKKALFIALIWLSTSACANDLIKNMVIERNKLTVHIHDGFKNRFLVDDFFIQYDDDINLEELPQSIVSLPFILTIFSTVWASGETYYVDSMDREVFAGLEKLKKIYKILYPKTPWKGKIIPRKVVSTPAPAQLLDEKEHIALLFSGGLDSTLSSIHHSDKKQLLISAWGQFDFPLNNPELWAVAKQRFINFAEKYGHTNTYIRSNYSEIFNHDVLESYSPEIPRWRMWTIEDVGWAGLTAPILYAKGYSTLAIASSDNWAFGYPSAANPFIDSTMRFAGLRLQHDLFNLSRFEKTEYLVNYCKRRNEKPPYLTICQQRGIDNCNDCGKCRASAMALFALGENPHNYGFYTTIEAIRPSVENYLSGEITCLTRIERFSQIQKKIKQRIDAGDESAKELEWMLDINLLQYLDKTFEKVVQSPIPWKKLSKICPEIEVPEYYLDPEHKHPLWVARDNEPAITRSFNPESLGIWNYLSSLINT